MPGATAQATASGGEAAAPTTMARVLARLTATYGTPENHPTGDALDGLVGTILSQHTSDVNSGRAHRALRAAFPTWRAVLDAPEEAIAAAIRSGGLAQLKARRIKDVLARVAAEHPDFDLGFLACLPLADARAWLEALPGVGPKSAACVLLFDLGRPALPVDTHVHRVARRLGLIGASVGAAAAHPMLEAQLRPEQVYTCHVLFITHGRRVCKAPTARCDACPLTAECAYYAGLRTQD